MSVLNDLRKTIHDLKNAESLEQALQDLGFNRERASTLSHSRGLVTAKSLIRNRTDTSA